MICDKCGAEVPNDEIYVKAGRNLCEDCYIAVMSVPKKCDVGAVSAARASRQLSGQKGAEGLTPIQQKFYDYVKEKGSVLRDEVIDYMKASYPNMTMEEVEGLFATMRHMELLKGHREGIGESTKFYVDLWDK
jgi:NMD protein affecting ribosome stability and mRNA decay